jgi:pyruvate dehydrogenase E2 component (dihydrolipoamide acetyltransferase)
MATKVMMEALSPTMEEGRLVEWKKAEGDPVVTGDVIAEIETDKAVMDLVARADGVLIKQLFPAGATVPVASVIGFIGEPGEVVDAEASSPAPDPADPVAAAEAAPAPVAVADAPSLPASTGTERVKASPVARRMARERGIDLSQLTGSGPEGRIIKRDVEEPVAKAVTAAPEVAGAAGRPGEPYEDVPLSQIRKTIAKRLAQSIGPIPTFYLTTEVDMERAAESRTALNTEFGDEGRVSFNDIILKAVSSALIQHPACNAWWQDDHIRYWNEVHLGMAVAIPEGLITPVIRHTEHKSLRVISAEARELAERARDRRLTPEEYTGSTFSVSNLGMLDIDEFTAIINPPEAGIIAVGRIVETPVVSEGQITIRRRMRLTMSCDHRVIDGATGAEFLRTLKRMLENPLALVW